MDQGGKERLNRSRTKRLFETAETVDQQTLHFSFFDIAQHPVGEFIEELIGRRLPENLYVTGIKLLRQRRTDRFYLGADSLRCFVKSEQHPRLLRARLPQKLEAQSRLAG